VESWFWSLLWFLLIVVPVILLWVCAIFDIFRRYDLTGVWKVTWLLIVICIPFFGSVLYFLFRPIERMVHGEVYTIG
jgi:hypothetical protein